MPHHVNLYEFIARQVEEESIVITAGDRTFTIPPPMLWDDPEALREMGNEEAARLLIGEDNWAAFTAAGGTASMVVHLVTHRAELPMGESPAS